jgi:pyruvate formate lyase activating enzyme
VFGSIFNFQRYSIHDGPGIRSTVFLSGCPLRCAWCCNPEAFTAGERFSYQVETREILAWLREDRPYFRNSDGGVTLSGGEPLVQLDFAISILRGCRKTGIGTALETCGEVDWDRFQAVDGFVDHYLFDIKHTVNHLHKRYTGQGNQRIFENLGMLSRAGKQIYLRVPLIPGCNLSRSFAEGVGRLARKISAREVHLLPYHRLGELKYRSLKVSYPFAGRKDLLSYDYGRSAIRKFSEQVRQYFPRVVSGG